MKKHLTLAVALTLLPFAFHGPSRSEKHQQVRPNIVFILIDDLRWDELGIAGHPFIKTPHIDRIAREGARFRNAFITTPLCSPSRASLMKNLIHQPGAARALDEMKQEMERLLKETSSNSQSAIAEKIVGTWKLVSIEDHTPNAPRREYNPTGYIIYDANGRMAVQITRRNDRAKFSSEEIAKATTEEKAAAFDSYAAYYGTYTIDEAAGTITHHVEGSLTPHEVGKSLVRYFRLSGNRITLIPVETNDGRPASSPPVRSLTWERVK